MAERHIWMRKLYQLPGWTKSASYYSASAGVRTRHLLHSTASTWPSQGVPRSEPFGHYTRLCCPASLPSHHEDDRSESRPSLRHRHAVPRDLLRWRPAPRELDGPRGPAGRECSLPRLADAEGTIVQHRQAELPSLPVWRETSLFCGASTWKLWQRLAGCDSYSVSFQWWVFSRGAFQSNSAHQDGWWVRALKNISALLCTKRWDIMCR